MAHVNLYYSAVDTFAVLGCLAEQLLLVSFGQNSSSNLHVLPMHGARTLTDLRTEFQLLALDTEGDLTPSACFCAVNKGRDRVYDLTTGDVDNSCSL